MDFKISIKLTDEDYYAFNDFCTFCLPHGKKQILGYRIFLTSLVVLIYGIYLLVALLCLCFGVLLLSKSDTDFLCLKKAPETECREVQKYRWFFTAFPVIMVIIICLIDATSYF